MISSAATIGSQWFLNGIANLQREQLKTQEDLSSGYRVRDASDAPAQTPALVSLVSDLASAQAYQANLGRVQAEAGAAEQAIAGSITLLDSARSLATQGASTATSAADRQAIAIQIQSFQQQIVSSANTSVEGRFIFGGDQDQSAPYSYNAASPTGVDSLNSPASTRTIISPDGQAVYRARSASTIFDHTNASGAPAADNVFSALQGLVTALQSNDPAGIAGSINALQAASVYLNGQQASYGVDVAALASQQNDTANRITSLQTQISGIRDTDVAQAATDLAQESTAQSAVFGAQASISQKSLFDYLA